MRRVFFVMPNVGVTGGNKVMLEYANLFVERDIETLLLTPEAVNPVWFDLDSRVTIVDRVDGPTVVKKDDVVVFSWDFDAEYVLGLDGAKVYLVQHFIHPREDVFAMPFRFVGVSSWVQQHTREVYMVPCDLALNGVDLDVFTPPCDDDRDERSLMRVLYIDRALKWKGVDDIKAALAELQKRYPHFLATAVNGLLPDELAALYRKANVFVSGSWYEGFNLPVLEAMACGCAVVTTDCRGQDDFVRHNRNALIVPAKNPSLMASALLSLLINDGLRKRIRRQAVEDSLSWGWDKVDEFVDVLMDVEPPSDFSKEIVYPQWVVPIGDFLQVDEYSSITRVLQKEREDPGAFIRSQWDGVDSTVPDQIDGFYKNTDAYVYALTVTEYGSNGYVHPMTAANVFRENGIEKILVYGGGIGTDVIHFVRHGGILVDYFSVKSCTRDFACHRMKLYEVSDQVDVLDDLKPEVPYKGIYCVRTLEFFNNPLLILDQIWLISEPGAVLVCTYTKSSLSANVAETEDRDFLNSAELHGWSFAGQAGQNNELYILRREDIRERESSPTDHEDFLMTATAGSRD